MEFEQKPIGVNLKGMIHRENVEIRDQAHLMDAEGAEDERPDIADISEFIYNKGFHATNIDIWFDSMMHLHRWTCDIHPIKS